MQIFSLSLAGFLYLILQISVSIHVILHKEDVKSSIGWIGLVWLSPLLGSVLYVMFGINRVRRKALALRNQRHNIKEITGKTLDEIAKEIPASFLQLLRLGHKVHPQNFDLGSKIEPLLNGDEAYPKMCAAIALAKEEVLIQSYIFDNDAAGKMFIEPIKQALQNGAKVRVLVDGVGLNYSRPNIKTVLRKLKGLEFAVFLPSKYPINLPFVNLRNHRKIMIIDGQTAFFGGMNIAKGNLIKTKPKDPIVDITFKVEGNVVGQMARLFLEDWAFASKKTFTPVAFEKVSNNVGGTPARIVPQGPDGDANKIEALIAGALSTAQKTISIVTPYFLPENNILDALEVAAMRGVEVEIILPSKSNIFGMDYAMAANFNNLLQRGIKIYQTKPPFDHSKIMIVDGVWILAGSANWDVRSFKLNFESAMEFFDPVLGREIQKLIETKKHHSRAVKLHNTPLLRRLVNNAFRLLTPYY
ncbi:MAG: phospholipase D-like domain-containing protein [Elusimicrobiota bacterium]|jgi:cardiolipin synthase|nr:phospholipase D-like domain-containing protein [Elusimicrobiota bacterium]